MRDFIVYFIFFFRFCTFLVNFSVVPKFSAMLHNLCLLVGVHVCPASLHASVFSHLLQDAPQCRLTSRCLRSCLVSPWASSLICGSDSGRQTRPWTMQKTSGSRVAWMLHLVILWTRLQMQQLLSHARASLWMSLRLTTRTMRSPPALKQPKKLPTMSLHPIALWVIPTGAPSS